MNVVRNLICNMKSEPLPDGKFSSDQTEQAFMRFCVNDLHGFDVNQWRSELYLLQDHVPFNARHKWEVNSQSRICKLKSFMKLYLRLDVTRYLISVGV